MKQIAKLTSLKLAVLEKASFVTTFRLVSSNICTSELFTCADSNTALFLPYPTSSQDLTTPSKKTSVSIFQAAHRGRLGLVSPQTSNVLQSRN